MAGRLRWIAVLLGVFALAGCKKKVAKYEGPYAYMNARYQFSQGGPPFTVVALKRTHGMAECEDTRALNDAMFAGLLLEGCPECKVNGKVECLDEPPYPYERVFDDEPLHQTYVSAEPGHPDERAERLVLWGLPVAQSVGICNEMRTDIKKTYKGEVKCIQAQ